MNKTLKKEIKRYLIKHGGNKAVRAAVYEYIYRQAHGMPWDNRQAYGVGLYYEKELYRAGITK